MNEHEKINYVELPTIDIEVTKSFFTSVFNWSFIDYGSEYTAFADQIGYDGYIEDLTKVYATNIGVLPNNFEKSRNFYEAISTSRKNYEKNKLNYPDLVVFSDSEQLIKERGIKSE
jgi:hypothetical protein